MGEQEYVVPENATDSSFVPRSRWERQGQRSPPPIHSMS